MSLWGNREVSFLSGTSVNTGGATGVTVTGVGTSFLTQVENGDLLTVGSTKAEVLRVNSNTSLTVSSPVFIAAGSTGFYVTELPKYLSETEKLTQTFGVDTTEAGATGFKGAHAGWVKRTVGTGGRSGRVIVETLVAMGVPAATMRDAEDVAFPDA
jgi:hypothetical protein